MGVIYGGSDENHKYIQINTVTVLSVLLSSTKIKVASSPSRRPMIDCCTQHALVHNRQASRLCTPCTCVGVSWIYFYGVNEGAGSAYSVFTFSAERDLIYLRYASLAFPAFKAESA
jgi:hypothetical protein